NRRNRAAYHAAGNRAAGSAERERRLLEGTPRTNRKRTCQAEGGIERAEGPLAGGKGSDLQNPQAEGASRAAQRRSGTLRALGRSREGSGDTLRTHGRRGTGAPAGAAALRRAAKRSADAQGRSRRRGYRQAGEQVDRYPRRPAARGRSRKACPHG